MAKVHVDAEVLREVAAAIDKARSQIESAIVDIQHVNDALAAVWNCEALQAFQRGIDEKRKAYREFAIDMAELTKYIREAIYMMENIDDSANRFDHTL